MLSPHLLYQQPPARNQYPMWYTPQTIPQWQAPAQAQAANQPRRTEPPKPMVPVKEQRPVNPMNVVRSEPERVDMPFRPVLPVAGVDYPMLPYGTRHRYL
jgi:hypothetical protein